LVEVDRRALLEVGADNIVLDGVVVLVTGVEFKIRGTPTTRGLDVAAVVAPAGGFSDKGDAEIIGTATPNRFGSEG
jgi:hypothetical protein